MQTVADNANSSTKQAGDSVSKFDKSAQKTQKSLASWAKEKYQILLEAKDKITPILSTIKGGLKSFTSKTWSVTMKAVDLITSPVRGIINLLRNPIFQAGAVLGVSFGVSNIITTYKDFEAAMSQVQATSGATSSELVKLTTKAKEMGATTKFTAAESAEAFNYMAMAGWNAQQMTEGIEGILNLAAASGEGLATTSDIVTDALTAFGLKASDATHFSDVLAQASSSANTDVGMMGETFKYVASMAGSLSYSIEDVALMTGLMANSGIKSTQAGTSLNAVLTRLATNSSGAADTIKELGVNFYDSSGNARPLATVMGELREATKGMNQEQKSNLANTVAGMEAQKGLLAILNASEEDYNKLAEAINNADGAAERMAEIRLDNLSGDITLFQSAVDGLKTSLGERLSNSWLRDIVQWLTKQIPNVEQAFSNAMDFIEKRIDKAKRKFNEISLTEEWQNSGFFGKTKILWDEFIVEPFSEWWKTKGKAKINVIAGNIGNAIGTGLKVGITTLLGIDISETINEGSSLGASFAKGFSEGFDFDLISQKIWDGLGNLFSNALKLLPGGASADLSSVMSAAMLMKIFSPLFGLTRGAFGIGRMLFGTGTAGGTSLARSFLGSTGNAMVGGSGLLGGLANVGYAMIPGGAAASTMSGGLAALSGAGAIAGGVVSGTALISSATDAYRAIKSNNKEESKAYGQSAAWKAGGVAAGALAGTAILPGLGTLIGGGIGGIIGMFEGNSITSAYQEKVEEMEREAERVEQIYELTGLSIDKVRFANDDLNKALHDTNISIEELAGYIQEDVARVAEEAFGDIHLSLTEIKKLAEEITFGDAIDDVTEFVKATETANISLSSLKSTISTLKKENWKASLRLQLDETEQEDYKKAIDDFVKSASQYIDDNHYQASVALKLITGKDGGTDGLNSMYNDMKQQIEDIGAQLSEKVTISLQDGVITLDEETEILNLQQQIEDITNKISTAKEEASLDALEIKYGNGSLMDYESFTSMLEEIDEQTKELDEKYKSAYELSLMNLHLQFPNEGEEFEAKKKEIDEAYAARLGDRNIRVQSFTLEGVAKAWDEQLNGILPDIEGSLYDKLSTAMNNALLIQPEVSEWTEEDVTKWFGLDGIDQSSFRTIYAQLKDIAELVPQGVKDDILQNYKDSVPTVEEIKAAIDWDSMTNNDWMELMESITGPSEGASFGLSSEDAAKLLSEYYGDFERIKQVFSETIYEALEQSDNNDILDSFIKRYMTGAASVIYQQDYSLTTELANSIKEKTSFIREAAESAVTEAYSEAFEVTANINVTPIVSLTGVSPKVSLAGALPYGEVADTASNHAGGGYVSGGPQLSWLAEEGYGEFIIPTNPSRRSRALDLYKQAGIALGVSAHAGGGYVGSSKFGSNSVSNAIGYNLFNEAIRNVPIGKYEGTKDNTEDSYTIYEPVSTQIAQAGNGNNPIEVSVQVSPEFVINGSSGQSEADIMAIIKKNMKAMADEIGGEIAERLEVVFSNMPTVKEA